MFDNLTIILKREYSRAVKLFASAFFSAFRESLCFALQEKFNAGSISNRIIQIESRTRCEPIENSQFDRTSPEGEQQVSKYPCHGTPSPRDRTNRTAMRGPKLPAERPGMS